MYQLNLSELGAEMLSYFPLLRTIARIISG
jgi:hypothetical protein